MKQTAVGDCFEVEESCRRVLVRQKGISITEMDIRGFAAECLVDFKALRQIVILDEKPKPSPVSCSGSIRPGSRAEQTRWNVHRFQTTS